MTLCSKAIADDPPRIPAIALSAVAVDTRLADNKHAVLQETSGPGAIRRGARIGRLGGDGRRRPMQQDGGHRFATASARGPNGQ